MDLGKTHIVVMWTVGPDEVAAGDAVFQSHGKWMEGHSREVTGLAYCPDGRTLASASLDQTVRLWDVDFGSYWATLTGHTDGVTALVMLYPKMEPRRIVGSDIAHAVPLTLVAGLGHSLLGSINTHILVSLLAGSIPAIIVMSLVAARASETAIRVALAAVLIVVCVRFWFF